MLSLNGKDKERMPLPTDGIVNYSYQSAGGILTIRFHTGNIFQYKGVNLAVYDVFNASKDKNVFYERSIKGKYSEQQVFEYVKKVKVGDSSVFQPTELKFADTSTVTWSKNADGEIEASASAVAGGGSATPTSAQFSALSARVESNSAQMTSADNAISAAVVSAINRVSALSVVVSNAVSAIAANSAQMTSADNALSTAINVVSAAQAATSARVTANSAQMTSADDAISAAVVSAINRISALSVVVSNAVSAIVANSAQMTSADNANSAATASAINRISALSVVVSNAVSAIVANSAAMTFADDTLSARIDGKNDALKIQYEGSLLVTNPVTLNFTGAGVTLSAAGSDVEFAIPGGSGSAEPTSAQFSALSARVAANSAQMTSADNAISAANAATSARVTANSAQMTSADNAISAAVVVVDGRVTSVMSAVSAESAARAAADTSLDGRITSLAAADTSINAAITSINTVVNTISAGLGGVQLKVVADAQTLSGTGLTKISGLSASLAAAGVYRLDGWVMYNGLSAISVVGLGLSTSGATFGNVGLRWLGNLSVGTGVSAISTLVMAAGWMNSTGFGAATYSANLSAANAAGLMVELAGVVVVSTTGGSIQMKMKSGTTGVISIRAGSYLRCFKLA